MAVFLPAVLIISIVSIIIIIKIKIIEIVINKIITDTNYILGKVAGEKKYGLLPNYVFSKHVESF